MEQPACKHVDKSHGHTLAAPTPHNRAEGQELGSDGILNLLKFHGANKALFGQGTSDGNMYVSTWLGCDTQIFG